MRVLMEVQRRGEQYHGSLTRVSDQLCVPFVGVLELLAALERLEPDNAPETTAADRPPDDWSGR
jgi:hypothetical protein